MRIAQAIRERGGDVIFSKHVEADMLEPDYDSVYGSAIFSYSGPRVARFKANFPQAIVGGTWDRDEPITVEQQLNLSGPERYDYTIYPDFEASIGFTQRGCRLKCGFCVVPKKEGAPRSVNSVGDIWRGDPYPKHLHLLDNDFFGQPREQWEARIAEFRDGDFKICFNQGINIRMVTPEAATALASIRLCDDQFKTRRLYTAWDNLGDEQRFFAGVDLLQDAGIPPTALLVYMLVGYDKHETWARIFHRFNRMVSRGIKPYPMVYGDRARRLELGGYNADIKSRTLAEFQRWTVRRAYMFIPFEHYDVNAKGHTPKDQPQLALLPPQA
jgi:hypothetical protein